MSQRKAAAIELFPQRKHPSFESGLRRFRGQGTPTIEAKQVDSWASFVGDTLTEINRVLRPGGHIAFEVGEVRGGALRLEEVVIPAGVAAGLQPVLVLINAQQFTKTANCWG